MDIYADNILDHFRHPRNHGGLQHFDIVHEESNVECGDIVKVWVKLDPLPTLPLLGGGKRRVGVPAGLPLQGGGTKGGGVARSRIAEIGWTGTGCAISQASMSILSEEIGGMDTEKVEALGQDDVYRLLGVPIGPRRFKCALMSLHAVKNALRKAKGLPPQSWVETVAFDDGVG